MVDIRTVSLPGIWAEDAQTTIPTPPIANTTYRNLEWGETEANQGWPFQKIVDSADFNQAMWYVFTLQKMQEQFGILPWCSTTAYKQNGICLGSDGIFYWAKKDNTGVNPVTDSGMTNWGVFLDPGDNFVTETLLNNQIALCEKLANKTQTLSSSSTTTQYPSAKAVYDNINNTKNSLQTQITANDTDITNLQNNKQNNITGGASTITTANLTANRALISNGSGKVAVSAVTNTELGYLDGVTSNIQTQLNGKQASGSYMTLSGNQTASGNKTFSGQIIRSKAPGASDNSNQVPNTSWVNSRISSIVNSTLQGYKSGQTGWIKINSSVGILLIQWGYIESQAGNPWHTVVTLPQSYGNTNYLILRTSKQNGNANYYPNQGNGWDGSKNKNANSFEINIGHDGGVQGSNWMTMGFV